MASPPHRGFAEDTLWDQQLDRGVSKAVVCNCCGIEQEPMPVFGARMSCHLLDNGMACESSLQMLVRNNMKKNMGKASRQD